MDIKTSEAQVSKTMEGSSAKNRSAGPDDVYNKSRERRTAFSAAERKARDLTRGLLFEAIDDSDCLWGDEAPVLTGPTTKQYRAYKERHAPKKPIVRSNRAIARERRGNGHPNDAETRKKAPCGEAELRDFFEEQSFNDAHSLGDGIVCEVTVPAPKASVSGGDGKGYPRGKGGRARARNFAEGRGKGQQGRGGGVEEVKGGEAEEGVDAAGDDAAAAEGVRLQLRAVLATRKQIRVMGQVPVAMTSPAGNAVAMYDNGKILFSGYAGAPRERCRTAQNEILLVEGHVGVELMGYVETVPGVYDPIDVPDTIVDLVMFEQWLASAPVVVTRRPWTYSECLGVALDRNGADLLPMEYRLEVPLLLRWLHTKAPAMNIRPGTYDFLVASLKLQFPGMPEKIYADTTARHLLVLLEIQLAAAQNEPIRFARNVAEAPIPVLRGGPAFLAHTLQSEFPTGCAFGAVPKDEHHDVDVFLSIPGFTCDGDLVTHGAELPGDYAARRASAWDIVPQETRRFKLVNRVGYRSISEDVARMTGIRAPPDAPRLIGRFTTPTPHDYPLGHNVKFLQLIPEGCGTPFTYAKTPHTTCDAANKRLFLANGGSHAIEQDLLDSQLLILVHVRELDSAAWEYMVQMLKFANGSQALLDFVHDPARRLEELGLVAGYIETQSVFEAANFPKHHTWASEPANAVRRWDRFQNADVQKAIARRSAAATLLVRIREARDRVFKRNWWNFYIPLATVAAVGIACGTPGPTPYRAILTILTVGVVSTVVSFCSTLYWTVQLAATRYTEATTGTLDANGYLVWMPRWWLNSAVYDHVCSYMVRAHAKLSLYLAMLATMYRYAVPFAGAEPAGIFSNGHPIEAKLKAKELAKPGKVGRIFGGVGAGTVNCAGLANTIKEAFCGDTSMLHLNGIFNFYCPPAFVRTVYKAEPRQFSRPEGIAEYVSLSDDETARVLLLGRMYIVNADASSADSTVGPAIMLAFLGYLISELGCGFLGKAISADFTGEWTMRNPVSRREFVQFVPTHACMPSGTVWTTLLQMIFSLCAQSAAHALFVAHTSLAAEVGKLADYREVVTIPRCDAPAYIDGTAYGCGRQVINPACDDPQRVAERQLRNSAAAVGRMITVGFCPTMIHSTFLKRFEAVADDGDAVPVLALGAILRKFGVTCGDITALQLGVTPAVFASMSLASKWERFARGVVAGYKHEPSHVVIDALRAKFPAGQLLTLSGDEKYQQELLLSSKDMSMRSVAIEQLQERYGGSNLEWEVFGDELRHQVMGGSIRSRLYREILRVDYGY